MRQFFSRGTLLAASGLIAVVALARVESSAPDPKAVTVIQELGLQESPVALRDLKGWKAPRRIVMITGTPYGEVQTTGSGVQIITVKNTEEMIARAADADAIVGGDNVVCDKRV